MRRHDATEWLAAVQQEDESLEKNYTWDVIDDSALPRGRRPLTSKYVFKKKTLFDSKTGLYRYKYKARMVARGFQQKEGIDYDETFATVVKAPSYRILMAMAGSLGWTVYLMDVKTAFLHGDLDVEIYIRPPVGMTLPKGKVLRLRKALYGLKQSPRQWYFKLTQTLTRLGFRVSLYDPCVFVHEQRDLIVALWVDDLLIAARHEEDATIFRQQMSTEFEMTDEGKCTYYLGMNVIQSSQGIFLHQERYATDILKKFKFEDMPSVPTPIRYGKALAKTPGHQATDSYRLLYQGMVGCLMWLVCQTRVDMAFATNYVARYCANPEKSHMDAVTRIYAYLSGTTDSGLFFARTNTSLPQLISGFADADFAGCIDTRRSTTGYVFLFGTGPVSWASKRQKSVSVSTMEAEYVAASIASREAIWIRNFVNDLQIDKLHFPHIKVGIDNMAAEGLTRNPILHDRAKHIDIHYHFVRERVIQHKDIVTHRVSSGENLADILTKPLTEDIFRGLARRLGMRRLNEV